MIPKLPVLRIGCIKLVILLAAAFGAGYAWAMFGHDLTKLATTIKESIVQEAELGDEI